MDKKNYKSYVAMRVSAEIKELAKKTSQILSPINPTRLTVLDFTRFLIWMLSDGGKNKIDFSSLLNNLLEFKSYSPINKNYKQVSLESKRETSTNKNEQEMFKVFQSKLKDALMTKIKAQEIDVPDYFFHRNLQRNNAEGVIYDTEIGSLLSEYAIHYVISLENKHIVGEFIKKHKTLMPEHFGLILD